MEIINVIFDLINKNPYLSAITVFCVIFYASLFAITGYEQGKIDGLLRCQEVLSNIESHI